MTENTSDRKQVYDALMNVPHRNITAMVDEFGGVLQTVPDFGSLALFWISQNSKIDDQVNASVAAMLKAPAEFPEIREAGRCVMLGPQVYNIDWEGSLKSIPPYRIFRVDNAVRESAGTHATRLMEGIARDYTDHIQLNNAQFDGIDMLNHKALTDYFTRYKIRPSYRAAGILGLKYANGDTPIKVPLPEDSKRFKMKQAAKVAQGGDLVTACKMVIEYEIPYTIATSFLPKDNPVVGIALIEAMTNQQALNSVAWVERSGLLNISEVRTVFEKKVAAASKSAATATKRRSAQSGDEGLRRAVEAAAQKAIETDMIERDMAIMVDASYSMRLPIQIAAEFGSHIAPRCSGNVTVNAFSDIIRRITVCGHTLSGWQHAFRMVRPGGATNMQRAVEDILNRAPNPPQLWTFMTDGGENRGDVRIPLRKLDKETTHIIVIEFPGGMDYNPNFARKIEAEGFRVDVFTCRQSDYYLYDQIGALMAGKRPLTLVERIGEMTLPHRVGWTPANH